MGTLKWPAKGDFCVVCVRALLFLSKNRSFKISLCTVLSDTWMANIVTFHPKTPWVRPKSAIYNPKRNEEHPATFIWESPTGATWKFKLRETRKVNLNLKPYSH